MNIVSSFKVMIRPELPDFPQLRPDWVKIVDEQKGKQLCNRKVTFNCTQRCFLLGTPKNNFKDTLRKTDGWLELDTSSN